MTKEQDRYTPNEIIADDLDDKRAKVSSNRMRRRIDREVVLVEEQEDLNAAENDEQEESLIDTHSSNEEFDNDDIESAEEEDDDNELEEDDEEEGDDDDDDDVEEEKRNKSFIDHIITGSMLTGGAVPYYRYFIAIAVMCFLSIFLTFISLNAGNECRRKEHMVTTLHERSVVKEEQRYGLSSKQAITERLKSYDIELVDLSKSSRLIEK